MSNSLNRLYLLGTLCADPELRYSKAGLEVLPLRIAVSRSQKNGTAWEEATDFFTCTVFAQSAQFLTTYAKKGDQVALECTLQNNNWTDKHGTKRYDMAITVSKVLSLHARKGQESRVPVPEVVETPPELEEFLEPDKEELPPEAWEDGEIPE